MTKTSTSIPTRCALFLTARRAGGWQRSTLLAAAGALLSLASQAQVTVTSRQPVRQAISVARNAAVTVGFSQAISAASAANMRVYGSQLRGRLPGSVSGGGTTALTFTPAQAFAPGEVLSVSLPASLASTGGTAVAKQMYQFTAATGGSGRGFFVDTTIVGNTGNRDQVLGDLDNDGDLDLVTTGSLYGCRIFLNNGAGRFVFLTGVIAAQTPSGVALADVDGDGDLDMLVGDADNAYVSVCINDGTGNFIGSVTGAQNAPVGLRPVGVAAGDVDGDGDLDFVTANNGGNSATVRFNNGSLPLIYTTAAQVAMGVGPTAVALADIDNDGDLDLLTTNAGTTSNPLGTVNVSRNTGTGSFGAYTSVAVGLQPSELALADIDNDGDLDLLTANAGAASVSVRFNNGSGTFTGATTLALPAGSTPSGLRTGDVDADGDLDFVVAQGQGGRVFTYLNTMGAFTQQARTLRLNRVSPTTSIGVTLGDVDGDLDLDVITSDPYGQVLLSRNLSSAPPLPVPTITSLTPGSGPIGVTVTIAGTALTDITGVFFNGTFASGFVLNGLGTGLDVAVPAGTTSGLLTVVTEEAGTATSSAPFTITVPVPVLLTSVVPRRNALNVLPNTNLTATFGVAVTAATASNLRVFSNRRRGRQLGTLTGGGTTSLTFDPSQDFAPGEQVNLSLPSSLRAADGNQVRQQVVQFTTATGGSGQLNFATATTLSINYPGEPVLGDIDNDGDLDFLTPNYYASNVSIRLNNGTGTFSSAPDLVTTASGLQTLTLGDVDGDGDLDLVAAESYSSVASIWLNNGSGTFVGGSTINVGSGQIKQVVLGDMDADGDQDIVLVNNQQVVVRLNNGAGVFSGTYGAFLAANGRGLAPTSLALGDVDNDGDLDAVVSGFDGTYGTYAVCVQLNDGAGQFASGQALLVPTAPGRVALGDLDGDGDLDFAVQNTVNSTPRISVRLNDGVGTFSGTGDLFLSGVGPVLGDADADGDLDIITHNGVGLNNGAGGFSSVLPIINYSYYPGGIAMGDLDGDLDLDLITSQESNEVTVRLNQPRPAPAITALAPGSGPIGTTVLLTGTNFIGTRAVAFNGTAALSYAVNSPTEVVATVPVGTTTGLVTLTTPAGTATSATPFTVTLPIAVVDLNPARNATSAPRSTTVAVTFAQPISSASAANFNVYGSRLRGKRAGTLAGGGTSTLTFTPAQAFAPGEGVSVSLPTSLAGTTSGNVRPHVYQFTAAVTGTGTGLFPSATEVPIYYRSIGMTVGDVDNDGDLDLFTTDGSIRLNNGAGAFSSTAGVSIPGDPYALAMADFNADGNLDLVTTVGHVRINTGTGSTFTALPNFGNFGFDTRDIAVGDLDGDGDIDVVVPKYSADSLIISYNNGTGLFPARQRVAVGSRPVGVAVGDVDNDGDLDLVAASEGLGNPASTLTICFNNGTGLFTRTQQLLVGSYVARVVLGDLDGDGDLDLVTSTGLVRFNDGTGTFTGTQTTATGATLALGDLDSDGDLDLVTTSGTTTLVRINNGQGQFSTVPGIGFGGTWAGLALADVDGDGDLDALATNSSRSVIHLSLNERLAPPVITSFTPGNGLVGATVVITGSDLIGTTNVAFNGTSAPGFVLNSATQITASVPAGATTGVITATNSVGTATSPLPFTVLRPVAVTSVSPARNAVVPLVTTITANFSQAIPTNTPANLAIFSEKRGGRLAGTRTGAGSPTLTLAPAQPFRPGERLSVSLPAYTEANQTRVLKQVYQLRAAVGGTGRGYLSAPSTATLSTDMANMVLGDVDNDGDEDMLVHHVTSVEVRLNNGAGSFSNAGSVAVTTSTVPGLVLGDVDGDGDLDLATTGLATNVISIRLNDGTGAFSGTLDVPVANRPKSVLFADMDADGDLDLVSGNEGGPSCTISVRFNDGTGNFSGTTNEYISSNTNTNFSNIEIGDVDADGDFDLLIGNTLSVYIMLNDGLGHLISTAAPITTTMGADILALGDLDSDGDLDLLAYCSSITQGTPSVIEICFNNGTGGFTKSQLSMSNVWGDMTVGDIDADGDLDIIVAYGFSDPNELWLNNGQGNYTRLMTVDLGYAAVLVLFSDVDNDGDLDVVSSNRYTSGTYSVRLNGPTPPPVIASFSPASGPEGTRVVITGSGFLGTTAVQFNGTGAPGFVINSPSQITATVPLGATTGPISVTTAVAVGTSATAFTVLPLVSVTSISPGRNAVAAASNTPINIAFAAPITAASASSLRVFGNLRRGRKAGALTGGGTAALSFVPAQGFAPGEQISVSIPAAMQTANGGLVRKQVVQFTTATGGPGRGGFRSGTDVPVARYAFALGMGDLDNDGDLDLLTSTLTGSAGSMVVLLNNGQAQFQAGTSINPVGYPFIDRVVLGDVDSDGDLDIVASFGSSDASVFRNNGNATFAAPIDINAASNQFALGDMDADGDLDLVGANYQYGGMDISFNNGTGIFTPRAQLSGVGVPTVTSLSLGDVDNDGDLDVVTSNNANNARVYLNDGDGGLSPGAVLAVAGAASSLALGDVDGDGDVDVVVGSNENSFDGWLTTFFNNGSGGFTAGSARAATGTRVSVVQLGDVDHDADLDVVAANGSSDDVSIRTNDGQGRFAGTYNVAVHTNPGRLALGDLDGDGDLDFAIAQATTGTNYIDVRLNDGQILATAAGRPTASPVVLYPNPAHGQFAVVVPVELRSAALGAAPLRLYNSVGQLVLEQPVQFSASGELTVDVARLPTGMYTLRLALKNGVVSYKVTLF